MAFQASMEGLTAIRKEILADQITDAMKVMGTTKTASACAWIDTPSEARTSEDASQRASGAPRLSFKSAMLPDPAFDAAGG